MKRILTTAILWMGLALVGLGCATMGGPTDEELIQSVVSDYCTALMALDFDTLYAGLPDDYEDTFGDKETSLCWYA